MEVELVRTSGGLFDLTADGVLKFFKQAAGRFPTDAVVTSVERRRRWSRAEKERIIAAMEPGAVASEVARAGGIHT